MTSPTGHGGDINLAALWVPVMPETSHMGAQMREAGRTAKREFEQGFNSGTSPEAMGQSFSSKLATSLGSSFGKLDLPIFGNMGNALDKLGGDIDKNLVNKLRGQATTALQNYRNEWTNLQVAQQRSSQLEEEITRRREAGLGAHSIIPLMGQQARATKDVESATSKAGAAHDTYITKTNQLGQANAAAADSGKLLAGLMGGAIVLGAQAAAGAFQEVSHAIIEGVVKTFEMGIDVAKELAQRSIELGETYEHIGIQIHEFSSASGEDFTRMEESAQRVFSTLDVAGNNTGQTMATLGSRLNLTGPALETLTRHVEELQGRFGNLNVEKLAVGFSALGVNGANADSVMASWLNTSRGLGLSFGDLTNTISQMADQLRPDVTGLTPEQVGRWVGEIEAKIPNAQRAIMGLSGAEKYFADQHLTFAEGLNEAAKEIQNAATPAEKEQLAETLFGTRKWADAMTMIQQYQDIVNQGPAAFQANSQSLEQFLSSTETLQNKWELVKHRIEDAFKPLGDAALKLVGTGLDNLIKFVGSHMDQIKHDVAGAGLFLIGFAADLQKFAEGVLEFFGPIVDGVTKFMAVAISSVASFGHLSGEILSNIPGLTNIGNGLIDASKAGESFAINLNKLHVGSDMQKLADWSKSHRIDVHAASDEWMKFWTEASGQNTDLSKLDSFKGSWWDSGNTAGIPTPPTAPGGPLAGQPSGPFGLGPPGAPAGPGAPAPGSPGLPGRRIPSAEIGGRRGNQAPFPGAAVASGGDNKSLAQQMFPQYFSPSEWSAFDQLEMSEAGYNATAQNPKSTAYGMGQFLDTTWAGYGSKTSDPAAQLDAMFRYIQNRYGTPSAAWAFHQANNWYGTGGVAGHPGQPRGTDIVPAWLTPGEIVLDPEQSDKLRNLLLGTGVRYYDQGTPGVPAPGKPSGESGVLQVIFDNLDTGQKTGEAGGQFVGPGTSQPQYYNADWGGHTGHVHTSFATGPDGQPYGLPKGSDIRQGGPGFPPWVYAVGAQFGLEASTYAGHQEGSGYNRGIDWWPRGHADMSGRSYSTDERGRLQSFASTISSLGVGARGADGPAAWGPGGPGAPTSPGSTNVYAPNTYGSPQTYDQQFQTQRQIDTANNRLDDLNASIAEKEKQRDKLNTDIATLQAKPALLQTQAVKDQIASKQGELERINTEIEKVKTRELPMAQQDLEKANYDATHKKPTGTTATERPAPGASAAQQLGSGFLKGIGQELGFGDIFAKSPLDWGIVKLATGLASWGIGTANAWADEIGKGHTGVTDYQPIEGWDQKQGQGQSVTGGLLGGLTGSLGINLPKTALPQGNVSAGPNVVPNATQMPPGPLGAPTGPAPGPVVHGDYMPINVQSGQQDMTPAINDWQQQRNSSSFSASGGLPQ